MIWLKSWAQNDEVRYRLLSAIEPLRLEGPDLGRVLAALKENHPKDYADHILSAKRDDLLIEAGRCRRQVSKPAYAGRVVVERALSHDFID